VNGRSTSASGLGKTSSASGEGDVHIRAAISRLREHLATHVSIHHGGKKGRIEIEYYGEDDLQRLLEVIGVGLVD
jgi:ParB family chromosome partitioning protein